MKRSGAAVAVAVAVSTQSFVYASILASESATHDDEGSDTATTVGIRSRLIDS
jgi:hypothetical protein